MSRSVSRPASVRCPQAGQKRADTGAAPSQLRQRRSCSTALGSDVNVWNAFMVYALRGGPFSYYADSSQPVFTNYWLEDANWQADYKSAGQYTFKLKLRQVVT